MYPGSEQAAHVHFHYDVIKAQYGSNARLLFTDTDSLCYHIRCLDFYKDMLADNRFFFERRVEGRVGRVHIENYWN